MVSDFSKQRKTTKFTKILIIIIWLLIITILGSISFTIYSEMQKQDESVLTQKPAKEYFSCSVFTVLYDTEYTNRPARFFISNFEEKDKQITIAALPDTQQATVGKKTGSLQEQFEYGGIIQAKHAAQAALSIEFDKYLLLPMRGLETVIDELGGISYTLSSDLEYSDSDGNILTSLKKGGQTMSGQQISQYLRYGGWNNDKCVNEGAQMISKIFEQHGESFAEKLIDLFAEISSSCKTDLTVGDVSALQTALPNIYNKKTPKPEVISVSFSGTQLSDKAMLEIAEKIK